MSGVKDWRIMKFSIQTAWLMGWVIALFGSVYAERLPIKIYTTGDGLANNSVHRIVPDSRGFLWFCTFEGLSRFDGYNFTTYGTEQGLPSPVVNDLLETRDGQYWVATAGGLCRFNPRGHAQPRAQGVGQESATAQPMFTVYFPGEDASSRNVIKLLETSAGAIWCGTLRGLYRIEERNQEVVFHLADIRMPSGIKDYISTTSIIEDARGALWIGTATGIYRLLTNGSVEHYYGSQHGLPDDGIRCLLEDREGRIWVGTGEGGLYRLVSDPDPGRAVVVRVYTSKDGLPTSWINQLFQASDGSLWAGSNKGLIEFIPTADGRDFRFRAYAQPHGLSYQEVGPVAEDRNGNLWVGVSGVAKIARSGITTFGEADGLGHPFPDSIFKNQAGELLVFVAGGQAPKFFINRFDGERFARVQLGIPRGVKDSWGWNQLVLEDRAGEWWVATDQGIYRFPKVASFDHLHGAQPKAVYARRDGLSGESILRLFEDSRGDIWISDPGSEAGLLRWERATETFHHYSAKDGLPFFQDSYVTSFSEDHTGAVWIGFSFSLSLGVSGGLVRYRDGQFVRFVSADGIPEGGIFNLFVDSSGRLWVPSTRGGLCRTDNPQAERPTFSTYTTADGLASNSVRCVAEDRQGRIYIGTARSIDRLDLATGHIRHYTTADGLPLGEPHAALQDGKGTLWFTFRSGLARLTPEPPSPPLPPPILITGLNIVGKAKPISALGELELAPVELAASENQLQIDFVALGFSSGEGLRYQYQFEGESKDWSAPSEQRTVNLNLAPGSYRFLVRAVNAAGATSETPASFSFTILPPIYQRWWFLTLAALALALAIYSLFRYRLAQRLEVERVRTRIAADLHDDIGSSLSQITILSEVLRQQLGVPEVPVAKNLSLINRVSQEALDSMSDIVWAINPLQDHLSDLVRKMRRVASDILPARNIEFNFTAPTAGPDLKLGADIRRQAFLMFKEAVNNLVRHAYCTRAEIELKVEGVWLVFAVTDNGKGFDPTKVSEGNGLVSLHRRARALGGQTLVRSRKGEGTTVTVEIPHSHHFRFRRGNGKPAGNGAMSQP
jgi:ligand-binding sensor domain-containing protein/signal transduction histidine kinase